MRLESETITLFLCGDVMTGRGVDQLLVHPSDPQIHESYLRDARDYVTLAQQRNGPIVRPVGFQYIWGDALEEFRLRPARVKIVNLETSVTVSNAWEDKGINYRMHPDNVPVLMAAGVDVCVLANNHTLDWGAQGLVETLDSLRRAGIQTTGAGKDGEAARAPAVVEVSPRGRVLVFSGAAESSGVPDSWAAASGRAGVHLLKDFTFSAFQEIQALIRRYKRPGDLVVFSVHWGGNWGYEISQHHVEFARRLLPEAAVDVVHGHSSHHILGVEVYRGKLIIYGCGDFLTDYEGIRGHEKFRGDLSVMFFPTLDWATGSLKELRLVPLRLKNMRLQRANAEEFSWIKKILDREGKIFGTWFEPGADQSLVMHWGLPPNP